MILPIFYDPYIRLLKEVLQLLIETKIYLESMPKDDIEAQSISLISHMLKGEKNEFRVKRFLRYSRGVAGIFCVFKYARKRLCA